MKWIINLALMTALTYAGTLTLGAQTAAQPRPKLGVSIGPDGLALESVTPGSVAAAAGLKAGDYLVNWNKTRIENLDAILQARDAAEAGSPTTFRVYRLGKSVELSTTLPGVFPEGGLVLGVTVSPGACVTKVHEGGAAAAAGMQLGDVLTGFDGNVIQSYDELRANLDQARSGSVHRITVLRGGKETMLRVQFPGDSWRGSLEEMRRQFEGMGAEFPFDIEEIENLPIPGMDMMKSLMALEGAKSEIDKSITELVEMDMPELAGTIKRLTEASKKLSGAARGLGEVRRMANSFMGDLVPMPREGSLKRKGEPSEAIIKKLEVEKPHDAEARPLKKKAKEGEQGASAPRKKAAGKKSSSAFNMQKLQDRVSELLAEGVTDSEELNAIIASEFPNVKVKFKSSIGDVEDFEEFDDFGPVKKKPASRPASDRSKKKRAASAPATPKDKN